MNYAEMYEKAKTAGVAVTVSTEIKSWENVGDVLVGKVIDVRDFEGGKYDSSVKQYMLETDEGVYSTILGAGTDKMLEGRKITGLIMYIEYRGKLDIGGGKRCNRFHIQLIDPSHISRTKKK